MIQDNMNAEEKVILELLKQVPDPEVGVNIVDLGLIYKVQKNNDAKEINLDVTLSTPGCPVGDTIIQHIQTLVEVNYPEFKVGVELVWEPEWNPEMISEQGLLELNS